MLNLKGMAWSLGPLVLLLGAVLSLEPAVAQQPTVMVVPSDRYMVGSGYYDDQEVNGTVTRLMAYDRAFQEDPELRQVITSIAGTFQDRGYPLQDLEAGMRAWREERALLEFSDRPVAISIRDEILSRARADIVLDLDFEESRMLGESSITFTLRGLDSYTSQEVASVTGTGNPGAGVPLPVMLREAVLQRMPQFEGRLLSYFQDVVSNGRSIQLNVRVSVDAGFDLEEYFEWEDVPGGEDELGEIISLMVRRAAVGGQVQVGPRSATLRRFQTVRIPVFDEEGFALDADGWANATIVRPLRQGLDVTARRETRGLGEVTVIITGVR